MNDFIRMAFSYVRVQETPFPHQPVKFLFEKPYDQLVEQRERISPPPIGNFPKYRDFLYKEIPYSKSPGKFPIGFAIGNPRRGKFYVPEISCKNTTGVRNNDATHNVTYNYSRNIVLCSIIVSFEKKNIPGLGSVTKKKDRSSTGHKFFFLVFS